MEMNMETAERTRTADAAILREITDLPSPRGIPILGNALQLDPPRLHQQLEGWAREFGPFYRLKLGKRDFVVVADHTAYQWTSPLFRRHVLQRVSDTRLSGHTGMGVARSQRCRDQS
jgi:hypothetical protein